ncbi:hypothetical protein DDZ14_03280 [Maritimibacter sp. 55A14]|uniref:DUF4174 domain-containing protein n=1 Tax=Maritimibacter sp. 55A14 TaxID=2174844 RepID=UPI000D61A6A3|nr:DUF4174 domain-containing protein [Maritimibacter sp. 55A14]PWE33704.1 hypothetical protein DDZ14_03280 [Maritimibacter sp. 55A14]
MTRAIAFLFLVLQAAAAPAQDSLAVAVTDDSPSEASGAQTAEAAEAGSDLVVMSAAEADLEALKWVARPIVVFADTPADPRFSEQMDLLAARPAELVERDVVVITDTDPKAMSPLRQRLRPRGFMLTIIAKDGTVALRKPVPWDVREITHAIDKMPMRRDEMERR